MSEERPPSRLPVVILIVIGAVLVGGSVTYVVATTMKGGQALEFFQSVAEAMSNPEAVAGRRLRLHGNVVGGTIQKRSAALEYRFAMFSGERWTEVEYRGLVPDSFKDCAEVVVKGKFDRAREVFVADNVTAKCPSKYDEKQRLNGCGAGIKPLVVARRTR